MILVTTSTPNYRVLDTDYTSYSIVYNCNTILGFFKTGDVIQITALSGSVFVTVMTPSLGAHYLLTFTDQLTKCLSRANTEEIHLSICNMLLSGSGVGLCVYLLFSSESVWYLTRQQTPEQAVVDQGYE